MVKNENIKQIYTPIRVKNNKNINYRFEEICKNLSEIEKGNNIREKILPLELDKNSNIVMKKDKISVDYVINCVASVSFNNNLDEACKSNIEPCLNLYNWSLKQDGVKRFIHISTAYVVPPSIKEDDITIATENLVNFDRNAEVIYNEIKNVKDTTFNNEIKNMNFPNTYTFTKALCEHMLWDNMKPTLPVSIVRPSMIGSDTNGYIKSYNATTIYFALKQQRLLPHIHADPKSHINVVPINYVYDIIVSEMIDKNNIFNIRNATTPNDKTVTNKDIENYFRDVYNSNIKYYKHFSMPYIFSNNTLYYKFLGIFNDRSKKLAEILSNINNNCVPFSLKTYNFQKKDSDEFYKNFDFIDYLHKYNLGIQKHLIKKCTIHDKNSIPFNNMIMIKGEKSENIHKGIMKMYIEFENNNYNDKTYQHLKNKMDATFEKGLENINVLKKSIDFKNKSFSKRQEDYEYLIENNDSFSNFNEICKYNDKQVASMKLNKPLFKAILLNNFNNKKMLIFNVHHIYCDAVSSIKSFVFKTIVDNKPNKNDAIYKIMDSKYNFELNIFQIILYCLSGLFDLIYKMLDKKDVNLIEFNNNINDKRIQLLTDTFDVEKIKNIDTTKTFNVLAYELFIKGLKSFNDTKGISSSEYIKIAIPVNLHKDSEYLAIDNNFVTASVKTKFKENDCNIKKDFISSMRPDKIYFLQLVNKIMYYLPESFCNIIKRTYMNKHSLILSSQVYSDNTLSVNNNKIINFNSITPIFDYNVSMSISVITYNKKLHYAVNCYDNNLTREFCDYLNKYIKKTLQFDST